MKILYLCNSIIPQVAKKTGKEAPIFAGWLAQTVDEISKNNDIMFMFPNNIWIEGTVNSHLSYVGFDKDGYEKFEQVVKDFVPNIVHIWGSELPHSNYMCNLLKKLNMQHKIVLSIQGLVNECARAYTIGIPRNIVKRWTLGDIARNENINKEQKNYEKLGEKEIETIKTVNHIIGRTKWDKSIVCSINKNVKYYHCGESLRLPFYDGTTWNQNNIDKYSIFVCQSSYPIKGFHIALQILVKLKEKYPNVKIRTANKSLNPRNFIDKIKQNSYQKYIRSIIRKYKLDNNIEFLGSLNAEEIKSELLRCNVLLSPSVIENSPNSIGEAMILGVPVVASNVGGVSSVISESEGYLYDVLDISSAVKYIQDIFENPPYAKLEKEVKRAKTQYNVDSIKNTLENIYNDINNII